MAITVTPTGAALGAEIGGVDLRRIGDGDFSAAYRAWLDHSGAAVPRAGAER